MNVAELTSVARGVAPVVRELVARASAGLSERLALLEQQAAAVVELKAEIGRLRSELAAKASGPDAPALLGLITGMVAAEVARIPPAPAGKDADPAVIERMVAAQVAQIQAPRDGQDVDMTAVETLIRAAVAALPAPKDGTSVSVADLEGVITAAVQRAVADIPPAKDGASVDPAALEVMVSEHVLKAIDALPQPKDGVSLTTEDVVPLVAAEVTRAVAALPAPKDGRSMTAEDVAPMIATEVARAVGALPVAKDGVGVVGALLDRSGHLIVTLSDGGTKDVGAVVGKDVEWADVERLIVDEVAKIPRPKDGQPGTDGLGFDDLDLVCDDRGCTLRFVRGDQVKDFPLPVPVYRGVFAEGTSYKAGELVTWGGSMFIARAATSAKPGLPTADSRAWTLCVKRGSDGKPASAGKDGVR